MGQSRPGSGFRRPRVPRPSPPQAEEPLATAELTRSRRHRREDRRARAPLRRRRRPAVRVPRSARRRLARQPRAREAARRDDLLQLQPASRSDERLRSELPVLLVRAAEGRQPRRRTRCRSSRSSTSCAQRANQPLTEVHIVNGLHPGLPFGYYTDMLRGLKRIRPEIHLKCFTAVEIAFFADHYGMTDEEVLRGLMDAGLDSLPGRRRGDLRRAGAQEDLARQGGRRSLPRRSIGSRTGSACART